MERKNNRLAGSLAALAVVSSLAGMSTAFAATPAPVATNDSYTLKTTASPMSLDVLGNDTTEMSTAINPATLTLVDSAGKPAQQLTLPNIGKVFVENGKVDFVPDPNFVGSGTFNYQVSNLEGGVSNKATVTINSSADTWTKGTLAVTDTINTPKGTAATIDVLANDKTNKGVTLNPTTLHFLDANGASVKTLTTEGGTYTITDDNKVQFTPADSYAGNAPAVSYQVTDSAGTVVTGTINTKVGVTDPNGTGADDYVTTNVGIPVEDPVTANDHLADGDVILPDGLSLMSGANHVQMLSTPGGTFSVEGSSIRFDPKAGWNGNQSVQYSVATANGNTITANFTVTVLQVNATPNGANITNFTSTTDKTSGSITYKIEGTIDPSLKYLSIRSPEVSAQGGDNKWTCYTGTTVPLIDVNLIDGAPGSDPNKFVCRTVFTADEAAKFLPKDSQNNYVLTANTQTDKGTQSYIATAPAPADSGNNTPTPTPSPTGSATASPSGSATPTTSPSASVTGTPSASPTATPTVPTTATITGTIFNDVNGNGKQDTDEPGIANAKVVLTDPNGKEVASGVTDANGKFTFENIPNGNYVLKSTAPDGTTQTFLVTIKDGQVISKPMDGQASASPSASGSPSAEASSSSSPSASASSSTGTQIVNGSTGSTNSNANSSGDPAKPGINTGGNPVSYTLFFVSGAAATAAGVSLLARKKFAQNKN